MALVTVLLAMGIFVVFCIVIPQNWWGKIEIQEKDEGE